MDATDIISLGSNIVTLLTAAIVLAWFFITQTQGYKKNLFDEFDGIYSGFVNPKHPQNRERNAGVRMKIVDTNDQGYFIGDLKFGEVETITEGESIDFRLRRAALLTFYGNLRYKFYRNKLRNPFKLKNNRVYQGRLFVVDRLDFQFEKYDIDIYSRADYEIKYYREMKALKFTLQKKDKGWNQLPEQFILHKSMGISFEPNENVEQMIFNKRFK